MRHVLFGVLCVAAGLLLFSPAPIPARDLAQARDPEQAGDPEAERILRDALRTLSGAEALSYTVVHERRVADRSQRPEPPVPRPGLAVAPIAILEPANLPTKLVSTRARVVWQRLPDSELDDEPRVKFSLDGRMTPVEEPAQEDGEQSPDSDRPKLQAQPTKKAKAAAAKNDAAKKDSSRDEAAKKGAAKNDSVKTAPVVDAGELVRAAFDGNVLRVVDSGQSTVLEYPSDEGALPTAGLAPIAPLLDVGFLPLQIDPENSPDGTLFRTLASVSLAGEKCHVIEIEVPLPIEGDGSDAVLTAGLSYKRRFYLAQSDLLPRRIEDIPAKLPGRSADPDTVRIDLTEVRVNPPLKASDFELPIPSDFMLQVVEPDVVSGVSLGDELPEVVLTDSEGNEKKLKEYRGKLVLLDFWASWCPACRLSMPGIQQLHDDFEKLGLVVLGVSIDVEDEIADARRIIAKKKFSYQMLFDGSDFAEDLGLRSIPHVILLDPEGRVIYQHTGDEPRAEKRLRRKIEERLKK